MSEITPLITSILQANFQMKQYLINYLKDTYGDRWKEIWKNWLKDNDWMETLHGAQAGDILTNVWFTSSGDAQIGNYAINGASDQALLGFSDYYGNKSPDLNTLYTSSSGIGVIRPDDEFGFSVVGQVGNIRFEVLTISRNKITDLGFCCR